MGSNSPPTKASPGAEQTEAEIEILRQLEKQRRMRYRIEANHVDGRPAVDQLTHSGDDPLLAALKQGKR